MPRAGFQLGLEGVTLPKNRQLQLGLTTVTKRKQTVVLDSAGIVRSLMIEIQAVDGRTMLLRSLRWSVDSVGSK